MDRSLFIQWEISVMFIDDFCNLPFVSVYRNVVEPLHEHQQRHYDSFYMTH